MTIMKIFSVIIWVMMTMTVMTNTSPRNLGSKTTLGKAREDNFEEYLEQNWRFFNKQGDDNVNDDVNDDDEDDHHGGRPPR